MQIPLDSERKRQWCVVPRRLVLCVAGFLCSTLAVSLNTNLSMAIVCMVDRGNDSAPATTSHCNATPPATRDEVPSAPLFQWSPEFEGLALGAVYWGQLAAFLPGGRAAERWGGRRTLLASLLAASLATLATPIAAIAHFGAFLACRIVVGIGTAPVLPVLFHLVSRWIPECERSAAASFLLAGYGTGAFASFLAAGLLCRAPHFGWPAVFYLGGACGLAWCVICYLCVFDTPQEHPGISLEELRHISDNLGPVPQKQISRIPWRPLLSSPAFWCLSVAYFGQFWILGFYSTVQTLYMGTVLGQDSLSTGALSCVPPLARGVFACACALPADWALRTGRVTKGQVRKGATLTNGLCSCAGFAGVLLFAGCSPLLNTLLFTFGGLLGDFVTFGVCMAAVDIAPNLSGTVSGILSVVGVVPFFVIPALVGVSTKHERSMEQWRPVFGSSICVVLVTSIVYLVFGTSEPQPWGTTDAPTKEEEDNNCTRHSVVTCK